MYPMNPVPGGFDPRLHGDPVVYCLLRWARDLKGNPDAATLSGQELLQSVHRVAPATVQELHGYLEGAVSEVLSARASSRSSACAMPGEIEDSSDGIDWYEPDPDLFYVLDDKSGTRLKAVLRRLRDMKRYSDRGLRPPNRALFIGGPGTGKTKGALWLASQLKLPAALIRIDGVIAPKVGETSRRLRACFETAQTRKAVIVIDEFEAVAVNRTNAGPNVGQWNKETTSALLQLLDSLPEDQILFAATNVPEAIDPAVMRRLRLHVRFYPPDREARASMIDVWWKKAPYHGDAKARILDLTEDRSGDELERIAEQANFAAADRSSREKITVADVEFAADSVFGKTKENANVA